MSAFTDAQRIHMAHRRYQNAVKLLREASQLLERLEYPSDEQKRLPERVGENIREVEGVRWQLGGMVIHTQAQLQLKLHDAKVANRKRVEGASYT